MNALTRTASDFVRSEPAAGAFLTIKGLTKSYGPVRVVEDITFEIGRNQVVSLVGENGAGKSTLFNILSGITPADQGEMTLNGASYAPRGYDEAVRLGVARVFQEQALIPNIPIYENLLLGHEARYCRPGGLVDHRAMIADASRLVAEAGLAIDVRAQTSSCNFSKRQAIEIARACLAPRLFAGAEHPLVLLDEPTSSLDRKDEEAFFALVDKVRRSGSVLFVSHRMSEVLAVSDVIYVLRDGRIVAKFLRGEAGEADLHAAMVGREMAADYYQIARQRGRSDVPAALQAEGVKLANRLISLRIGQGEVVGIGGLLDSGKSELGRVLSGVTPQKGARVAITDRPSIVPLARNLFAQGLGYIPAERLAEGIIASFPLSWNISLPSGYDLFRLPGALWNRRKERRIAEAYIQQLSIRSGSPGISCQRLSGGNQQKVVLARWLARSPKVLILDNPTRGVDAGAKQEIYSIIRDLTEKGVGILLITDELMELIGLSDRILIMQQGDVWAEVPAPPDAKPAEQTLVELMMPQGNALPPTVEYT